MAKSFIEKALPVASAVTSFVPELFKFFAGQRQINQANRINPTQPDFVMNQGILNNNKIYGDRYNNYRLPGYGNAVSQIGSSAASAFNNGVQGASSGSDVLALATGVQAGQDRSMNNLNVQNVQGAEDALRDYTQSNVMAGNEAVRKNMYELEEYQRQLEEKAALLQAGNQNRFSAGDNIANGVRYFTQPQEQLIQPGSGRTTTVQKSIFG